MYYQNKRSLAKKIIKARLRTLLCIAFVEASTDYSGRLIASLGQTEAQVPHSVHSSGLMW